MSYDQILFEQKGRVGLITLNRPEKLNAWTDHMMGEIRDAMDKCAEDKNIGAVVMTGSGRGFCAGADVVSQFKDVRDAMDAGRKPETGGQAARGSENWVSYLQKYPKPTVAAINGIAVGIGVTLVLPMDIRIAADSARLGLFFVKMGLTPELASSHLLPQMVGTARALDWCMTGRWIPAAEAKEAGLVSDVAPAEELTARALALGELLAGNAAPAMRAIRSLLLENANETDVMTVLSRENKVLTEARGTWEHKEAITAFLEKRDPNFSS